MNEQKYGKIRGGYEFFKLPIHDIDFKTDEEKLKPIIPDSFIGGAIGKTGAGKTTLVEALLCHNKAWKNKYKKIIYINPNQEPSLNDDIDKELIIWMRHFDVSAIRTALTQIDQDLDEEKLDDEQEELIQKITNEKKFWVTDKCLAKHLLSREQQQKLNGVMGLNKKDKNIKDKFVETIDFFSKESQKDEQVSNDPELKFLSQKKDKDKYVLIIFDDVISEIKNAQFDQELTKLFFNRRWINENFVTNILIAAQKYTYIPAHIRTQLNFLMFFQQPGNDLNIIKKEQLPFPPKAFEMACIDWWAKHKMNFVYIYNNCIFGNFEKFLLS